MEGMGVQPVYEVNKGHDGDGMWGGGGMIALLLIFALFSGGVGFGGRGAAGVDNTVNAAAQFTQLDSGIRAVQNGLCSLGYDLNNSIKDTAYANAMATKDGFYQLGNGMSNLFFGVNSAIANLGTQMQVCCCETQRGIDSVNYNGAKNTCDIITAITANTQRIIDVMNCNVNTALRDEVLFLKLRTNGCSPC